MEIHLNIRSGMEHWLLPSLSGAGGLLWCWRVVHGVIAACILGAAPLPAWSRLLLQHLDETSDYPIMEGCYDQ